VERQSNWDIDVDHLKKLRDAGVLSRLIDVREPHEYEICNLGGELMPLRTLAARIGELDPSAHIAVHCRSGARSARAVASLRGAGFDNAWNVSGGILAWIERIDPTLTRY
jgi:adenylyltransferase/sulfurtransferase